MASSFESESDAPICVVRESRDPSTFFFVTAMDSNMQLEKNKIKLTLLLGRA